MLKQSQQNSVTTSVCNVVILGTLFVITATTALLLVNLKPGAGGHILASLLICGIAFLYTALAYLLLRRSYYRTVSYMLVLLYMLLAGGIVWSWGINTPIGPLIFALVIVLAGILLTASCALGVALISGLIVVGLQVAASLGLHQPDTSWMTNQSTLGDAFAYFTVFIMLALISWLYNREMERSLMQAKQAEMALQQQKATLKLQVKQRTAELRRAQLDEMRHMYRFAELGQYGVTLLHDLANHLTALTLEVEGIKSKGHSQAVTRIRRITRYLGGIVENTRDRLQGRPQKQTFDIIRQTSEAVAFLQYKAEKAGVVIDWQPPAHSWKYVGDSACFNQVIAIITSNAIDAYDSVKKSKPKDRRVVITMQESGAHIIIKISDHGRGITKKERQNLFKPFHSAKKSGLGVGLFIARQTVEMNFLGTIALSSKSDHTEFIIKLPLGK